RTGGFGGVPPWAVVFVVPHSGVSRWSAALILVLIRLHVPLICMTGRPASRMVGAAVGHLCVKVPNEACPLGLAPTSSTPATLVMGAALALALLTPRVFPADDFALSHPGRPPGRTLPLRLISFIPTCSELPHF
ncbi:SIS domain-containing protein, partial [Salmonella enterica]|uniref:SIS domain-containing protein n=1 Tax=Salmonella enterica TaxID=28901 RepID=UPI00398C7317